MTPRKHPNGGAKICNRIVAFFPNCQKDCLPLNRRNDYAPIDSLGGTAQALYIEKNG